MEFVIDYLKRGVKLFGFDLSQLPLNLKMFYVSTDWERLTVHEQQIADPWIVTGYLSPMPMQFTDRWYSAMLNYKSMYGGGITWETYAAIDYCRQNQTTLITDNGIARRICTMKDIRFIGMNDFQVKLSLKELNEYERQETKIKKSGSTPPDFGF